MAHITMSVFMLMLDVLVVMPGVGVHVLLVTVGMPVAVRVIVWVLAGHLLLLSKGRPIVVASRTGCHYCHGYLVWSAS